MATAQGDASAWRKLTCDQAFFLFCFVLFCFVLVCLFFFVRFFFFFFERKSKVGESTKKSGLTWGVGGGWRGKDADSCPIRSGGPWERPVSKVTKCLQKFQSQLNNLLND